MSVWDESGQSWNARYPPPLRVVGVPRPTSILATIRKAKIKADSGERPEVDGQIGGGSVWEHVSSSVHRYPPTSVTHRNLWILIICWNVRNCCLCILIWRLCAFKGRLYNVLNAGGATNSGKCVFVGLRVYGEVVPLLDGHSWCPCLVLTQPQHQCMRKIQPLHWWMTICAWWRATSYTR